MNDRAGLSRDKREIVGRDTSHRLLTLWGKVGACSPVGRSVSGRVGAPVIAFRTNTFAA